MSPRLAPTDPTDSSSTQRDFPVPNNLPQIDATVHSSLDDSQMDNPCHSGRRPTKRKAKDMERRIGKSLVDTYSKRSASLLKKGEELAELTGAYVMIFAARPESIGEGMRRFYQSEQFKSADAELLLRINKVTRELEDIMIELAHRAGWKVHRHKKLRAAATTSMEYQPDLSLQKSVSNLYTVPSPLIPVSETATRLDATPNNMANLSSDPSTTHNDMTAFTTGTFNTSPLSMEPSEIASTVQLLETDKDVPLAVLRKLVQSDIGVRAVCDAKAIPLLVNLLDKSHDGIDGLACRSALILAKMTDHPRSCFAMIRAGALPHLIRLLWQEIGDEVLVAVGRILAQSILKSLRLYESSNFDNVLPKNVLEQLVKLLEHGRMEVRLAAAEAIGGIAANFDAMDVMKKAGAGLHLCHLVLDCRNLSEKELVVSAISELGRFDPETVDIIKTQIMSPLIRLLDNITTDSETAIAACRVLREPMIWEDKKDDTIIIPHLKSLLSHPDDEVFVEAAWTALSWTWIDTNDKNLPGHFDLTVIGRLIRLLHHEKERIVVSAARGIAEADNLRVDFLLEMVEGGGVPQLIHLLTSSNVDVAAAALNFFQNFNYPPARPAMIRHFLKHGIIPALVRIIAFDTHPLLQETLETLKSYAWDNAKAIVEAGAILHLVRLLSSKDVHEITTDVIRAIVQCRDLDEVHDPLLDAGVPGHLVQHLRRVMDSIEVEEHLWNAMYAITDFVVLSSESRKAFQAAGAESVLTDYLNTCALDYTRSYVTRCLNSLRWGTRAVRKVRNQAQDFLVSQGVLSPL